MTEREKMLSGALYASEDPELAAARIRARTLCGRLNQTPPEEREAQEEIIRRLFASVGENSTVNPVFWCDYGSNITAGDNFYVNYNCVILDCASRRLRGQRIHCPQLRLLYRRPPPGRPYPECRAGVRQAHHRGQ